MFAAPSAVGFITGHAPVHATSSSRWRSFVLSALSSPAANEAKGTCMAGREPTKETQAPAKSQKQKAKRETRVIGG
jgi:hypothetical protein